MLVVFPAFHMYLMRRKYEDDKGGLLNNNRDSPKCRLAPFFNMKHFFNDYFSVSSSRFTFSSHLFLSNFKGHSPALLLYLHETSKYTGDYQIKTLLQDIVDRKEVTTPTVLSRVNFILSGWYFLVFGT